MFLVPAIYVLGPLQLDHTEPMCELVEGIVTVPLTVATGF
jgi:hypothetical protein